jgi:hypothetical protein
LTDFGFGNYKHLGSQTGGNCLNSRTSVGSSDYGTLACDTVWSYMGTSVSPKAVAFAFLFLVDGSDKFLQTFISI